MAAAIERDPLILTRALEAQAAALIVEPLRELIGVGYFNSTSSRRLIIIDGLDECDTLAAQRKVLEIISFLIQKYHLPILIFVASRPERHLTQAFNTGFLPDVHTTLALDHTYRPDDDIRRFLTDIFRQVRTTHPMSGYLDHSWPSVDVLERLVKKSSGQFIYASTVVKYVSSIGHHPADRLNVILGIRPPRHAREMPFGELDTLYRHILSSVEDRKNVLLILGFCLISSARCPPTYPKEIERLERFFRLNRGDIRILLGDLSSIVAVQNPRHLRILHASFGDFLLDASRSKEFHINLPSIHTICMHLCFQHNKQCKSVLFHSKKLLHIST